MACKLLIAGALAASLVSTAAFATVTPLGNLDPDNAGAFGDINPTAWSRTPRQGFNCS